MSSSSRAARRNSAASTISSATAASRGRSTARSSAGPIRPSTTPPPRRRKSAAGSPGGWRTSPDMSKAPLVYLAALGAATLLFLLVPDLDLWASGLFYRAGDGFFLGDWGPVRALYRAVPLIVTAQVVGIPLLVLLGWWRRRPVAGIDLRVGAFLLLALALGPGVLVNSVLKEHWGRARPSQVIAFGGTQEFT